MSVEVIVTSVQCVPMYFALLDSLRSYLAFLQLGQKQERGLAGEDFLVRAQNGATNV